MNKYTVLWIDDIFNKDFDRLAYQNGIKLVHFKTSLEGMSSLELGLKTNIYDAVILDGLAYDKSEDEEHSIDGLINSLNIIDKLRQSKWFPVYIFTGELNKMEYKGDVKWIKKYNVPIVTKGVDNKGFIDDLIAAVDKQEITNLKNKYPNAFSVCDDGYLGSKEFARVLQLIKDIENPENILNQQDALLPMRKVLEAIFKKLNSIGLIPDEIQNGKGAINGASIFLAGNNRDYNYKEELIHPVIAESIRHLLGLTQDASHNEGTKLGADTYLSNTTNTYLYQSLCFSLLEVLDYIKSFIDNNSDKIVNQSKWEAIENKSYNSDDWILGTVERIAENGWGTFKPEEGYDKISIIPQKVNEFKLCEGDQIKIKTQPSPDGKKTYITDIKTTT
jgi:translation initiation factor IF-1